MPAFKAGKGLSFELNGYFNSKSVYGTGIQKSYHAVSVAAQKMLLKDKASINYYLMMSSSRASINRLPVTRTLI